jgi:hypothetical protein
VTSAPAELCSWFEQKGVLAEERGESIDEHLAGCPRCRQRQAEIAELRDDLARIAAPAPRAGWERAVWQRIDGPRERSGRRLWLWLAVPMAAAAVLLLLFRWPTSMDEPRLAVHFEHDPLRPRTRGDVAVGDTLVMEAAGIAAAAELRVYGPTARAVFRCSGPPGCERTGDRLRARWTVPSIGQYRVIVVASRGQLPAPVGSLDDDLSAATASGAVWQQSERLEVW